MSIMLDNQIKERVFLVGCPRSGTTLLQSLLAAHPEIASFPESFFFNYLVPSKPFIRNLGIASRWARPQLIKFLAECDRLDMVRYLPKTSLFMSQYARSFTTILDSLTTEKNKSIWLEKTPSHVHYIEYIERFVKEAKFIHIIRNGRDVTASLYEVTNQYPESWRGVRSIEQCIETWSKAVKASNSHLHKANHILVEYEQLLDNPQLVLSQLCEYLNIDFNPTIFEAYAKASQQLVLSNEPWKKSVEQKIEKTNSNKFSRLFDLSQQEYITEKISRAFPAILDSKKSKASTY